MNQSKENLFIDWLCGKSRYFPFFKRIPKVPMPIKGRCIVERCGLDANGQDEDGNVYCSDHTDNFIRS